MSVAHVPVSGDNPRGLRLLGGLIGGRGEVKNIVRLGVIGTSGWTELMYLNTLRERSDVEITALCGRSAERLAEVAAKHGIKATYTDYRRMFAEAGLDAVVVAAPDDQHKDMVLAAIDAGLHVLCEKPLANTAADARSMLGAAERRQVKHMVLFTWRWQPHYQFLKAMIDNGDFGTIYRASFSFLSGFARGNDYQWRYDPARCNGVTGDLGSHMIDLCRWMLGDIESVSATLGTSISRHAVAGHERGSGNDSGHLSLKFASGTLAVVDVTAVAHSADMMVKQVVRIEGEKATLDLEHVFFGAKAGVTMRLMRADRDSIEDPVVPERYFGKSSRADFFDIYRKESVGVLEFVNAIREGRPVQPGFDVGLRVQEVVDAAMKSHAAGQRIIIADV